MTGHTRDELEQAALWRSAAVARLDRAVDELEEAVAGMPISVERVQARRALQATLKAHTTCSTNLATATAQLAEIAPVKS